MLEEEMDAELGRLMRERKKVVDDLFERRRRPQDLARDWSPWAKGWQPTQRPLSRPAKVWILDGRMPEWSSTAQV